MYDTEKEKKRKKRREGGKEVSSSGKDIHLRHDRYMAVKDLVSSITVTSLYISCMIM